MTNKETITKSMLRLAIPISLQQLFAASLHLIDTAMVVQLGDVSTAAIGAAGRWFFLNHLFFFGFASGMSVLVAQYWGIKDETNIRQAYGLGLANAMVAGLLFTLAAQVMPGAMLRVFSDDPLVVAEGARYLKIASYAFVPLAFSIVTGYLLRSTEQVILPLVTSFVSVMVNTLLNYILIFGKLGFPAMGIEGAAIATAISSTLQMVLMLVVCIIKRNIIVAKIQSFLPGTMAFVKKYYKVASPVLVNEVLWALGFNAYNMVLARQGSSNYAAYTIFTSMEQIAFTLFVGVCSACAVMVGKKVGSGKLNEGYDIAKKFMISVPLYSLLVGAILALSSTGFVQLLNVQNPYTAQMARRLLMIYGAVIPVYLIPYIAIVGVFRAGGDTKTGLLYEVMCMWLVGVPAVAIAGLVLHLPFEWIFLTMYLESFVKSVLCIRHFKKRTWLIQLTA